MAFTQFKGFKRVLSTNTAYSGATHDDFLYFVRKNADDKEGEIWFQGMCYGSCRDSEIDKINTALAGFLDNQGEQGYKNVKQYIDDLINGKNASVTGTSTDGHVTVQVDEAAGALTAATVTTVDIASASATTQEMNYIEEAVGLAESGQKPADWGTGANYYTSGDSVMSAVSKVDDKLEELSANTKSQLESLDYNLASGDSAVLVSLNQTDGKVSAATENIANLKITGYAEGADADIAATDTLGQALGKLQGQINAMDKDASAVVGQVVTTVAQADGKVTETKANVKDLQLGGYVKDTAATGDIASADTINAALSKLENKAAAITIANADGSINVTPGATGTDINVNVKSGEKVIKKDGNGGIYTNLNLVKITESLPTTVKERYEFRDSDNNKIGESIDIAKDSHIVSITYDETTQKLIYKYLDASGVEQTTEVDMAHLILETEVENGIQSINGKLSIKLDTTGDDTGDDKFLTVGENGLKLDGVTDAINAAITGLSYADTAVTGQYVTEVDQTDGIIAVQRANVSDAVLNGYAKGQKPASTAISASDDVKGAIAKLEHQIDDAKAAATTKVVEGTDEGGNMTIVPTTGADESVTYTVNLTDVASKAALDAEIAARKAVDGQNGDTYAANTGATYISGASSLNDADVKLDTALKAVADKVEGLDYTGVTDENTKVVTDVKQENGLVSASATSVGDLVITAVTTADTKVAANDNLATIAGKLQGQIDAMDLPEVHESGAAIVSVSEADGKVSAATGDVNTDHVVLASAITGTTVTGMTSGKKESEVLQAIVDAIANLGGNALTGVTSTGHTLHVDPVSGNVQNVEFLKEAKTDTTVADGHLELVKNGNNEWYGVMYWIDEETNQG